MWESDTRSVPQSKAACNRNQPSYQTDGNVLTDQYGSQKPRPGQTFNPAPSNTPAEFKILQRLKAAQIDGNLNPTQRGVLIHLMMAAGPSGETFWPHENLARAIGISVRQSQRITATLHAKGYLKSIQQGLRRPNRYLMPWNSSFSDPTPKKPSKPMSVPIEKESFVKDLTSSSSSVPPPVQCAEEEEGNLISNTHPPARTAEEVQWFRQYLHNQMGGNNPPSVQFTQNCLNQAPTWTTREIVQALNINAQERVFKPKSYVLFKVALKNLYADWNGIAPELPVSTEWWVDPYADRQKLKDEGKLDECYSMAGVVAAACSMPANNAGQPR